MALRKCQYRTNDLLNLTGNFPGKFKENRSTQKVSKSTQICLKYSPSTFVLSTLMTHAKKISNWSNPEGQEWDMSEKSLTFTNKVNFQGKAKTAEAHKCICVHICVHTNVYA